MASCFSLTAVEQIWDTSPPPELLTFIGLSESGHGFKYNRKNLNSTEIIRAPCRVLTAGGVQYWLGYIGLVSSIYQAMAMLKCTQRVIVAGLP
jgi:hypothetical protein